MHPCTKVSLDYFNTAKTYTSIVEIDATPEQIFESFENANDWPKWVPPIKHVEWTSAKPFGVGTTRTVTMIGLVGNEVFIAWDYPQRMAFCFAHASQPLIESFAEDYIVTPLENGKTQLVWRMAMTPKGVARFSMAIFGPFMGWGNQWMLNRFKKFIEKRYQK